MTNITGGIVRYERSVKTGDYESKKFAVELTFSVADGQDNGLELADRIGSQTVELVHVKLGLKPGAAPAAVSGAGVMQTASRTKADLEAEAAAKLAANAPKKLGRPPSTKKTEAEPARNITTAPEDRQDPAAMEDAEIDNTRRQQHTVVNGEKVEEDPAAMDDLMSAAPAKISDEDMVKHITATNGRINNAPAIRETIGKFVAPPSTARDIPQAQRPAFLKALDALKKA